MEKLSSKWSSLEPSLFFPFFGRGWVRGYKWRCPEVGLSITKAWTVGSGNPILSGRDVFAVLPTGFGKSLCFAVLPLAFDKLSYFFSNRRLADIHLCTAAVAFHITTCYAVWRQADHNGNSNLTTRSIVCYHTLPSRFALRVWLAMPD